MAVINNKKTKVSDEIPSSSMADIAFLLLIFFLVTTVFPKDKGLAIVLPEQQDSEVEIPPKNIMTMIVQPNGLVDVRIGESQQSQTRRPNEIEALWRQNVAQNPNLIAAVKTHPDASYRYMVDVLDALESANAERISLQIYEGN